MRFSKFLLETQTHKIWHVTSLENANNIMQNGFKPQHTNKGMGVSFSVIASSARGLLRSLQRMNSFKTEEEVLNWFREHGVDANQEYKSWLSWIPQRSPSRLYLSLISGELFYSLDIPREEFLWVDLAKKLIGKQVVSIEAEYSGNIPNFRPGAIEAEMFLKDVSSVRPVRVIYNPEEI